MRLCPWEKLPESLRIPEVKPYYDILRKKGFQLFCKRVFDIFASLALLLILCPAFIILAIAIKIDSKGPVFYRQIRVTQYGKTFRIHKFRSMCDGADQKGSLVTTDHDMRVTKVGRFIRKFRLDEISQLLDILSGNMTFVGTRPEVPKYVAQYTPEMMATLLLPAGVTSEASISYKDEETLLKNTEDTDVTYVEAVLPEKMKYNLNAIKEFNLWSEIKTMLKTIIVVTK